MLLIALSQTTGPKLSFAFQRKLYFKNKNKQVNFSDKLNKVNRIKIGSKCDYT